MEDLTAQRDKLLTNAADCELIANLATDRKKRETFRTLATDLRKMVADMEEAMAAKKAS